MSPIPGLRQRNGEAIDEVVDAKKNEQLPAVSIKDVKQDQVIIEGTIYSFEGFKHPGGDIYQMFGGNDVSVLYKMVHPYHTAKHLEKMKAVGKASDWNREFLFDTPFEREIKTEVFSIIRRGREFGTPGFFARAFFYIGLLFYCQYQWAMYGASWSLAVIFGIAQAFIGLNVQHDANHGAASRKPWINDILGFGADLIGGGKWLWMQQHWTHHAFTNHAEKDSDAISAEPFFAFNDYPLDHPNRRWWHKFQGVFFLPFLSLYWLSMVLNPQSIDLMHRGSTQIGIKWDNDFMIRRRKYSVALRVYYIFVCVVRPFMVAGGFSLTTLLQILLMGNVESLMLATLFALSHNFENADRDPTKAFRETGEPVCWYKAQVEASCTYGGWWAGALTGGLNFQVEHHLFPRMSSAWYPYIAPKVQEICAKHGVRYVYYPYIWQNLVSTIRYMHNAGTGRNWEKLLEPLEGK